MTLKARAIIIPSVNKAELTEVDIPELGRGEILVKTEFSCVSPGTELRCMLGKGEAKEFPYIPGYSMTGTVIKTGPETSIKEGTKVFAGGTEKSRIKTLWGAHIEYAVKSEKNVIPLPDDVNLLDAALARLAAISYHAVRFSQPTRGKKIAVIGLGPIGQFSARIHHELGAEVVGADIIEAKIKLLEKSGINAVNSSYGLKKAFDKIFAEGADVIVDCTGVASLIPEIMTIARDLPWDEHKLEGTKYIFQASYSANLQIPYMDAFWKEITFFVSRDMQRSDYNNVIKLIREGKLTVKDIAEVSKPEDAQISYERLREGKLPGTIVFNWNTSSF